MSHMCDLTSDLPQVICCAPYLSESDRSQLGHNDSDAEMDDDARLDRKLLHALTVASWEL